MGYFGTSSGAYLLPLRLHDKHLGRATSNPPLEEERQLALDLLPSEVHKQSWIAGSAAIAPETAADLDVWVLLGGSPFTHERLQSLVQGNLDRDAEYRLPNENYEGLAAKGIYRLGDITMPGLRKVSLFAVYTTGIASLLEQFDISSHAFAVPLDVGPTDMGLLVKHPRATLVGELPRVLQLRTPADTFCRLRRVMLRYGRGTEAELQQHPDLPELLARLVAPVPRAA